MSFFLFEMFFAAIVWFFYSIKYFSLKLYCKNRFLEFSICSLIKCVIDNSIPLLISLLENQRLSHLCSAKFPIAVVCSIMFEMRKGIMHCFLIRRSIFKFQNQLGASIYKNTFPKLNWEKFINLLPSVGFFIDEFSFETLFRISTFLKQIACFGTVLTKWHTCDTISEWMCLEWNTNW